MVILFSGILFSDSAQHLNMYLQNGFGRTQTNSQSFCLPSTSSNNDLTKNKKVFESISN